MWSSSQTGSLVDGSEVAGSEVAKWGIGWIEEWRLVGITSLEVEVEGIGIGSVGWELVEIVCH